MTDWAPVAIVVLLAFAAIGMLVVVRSARRRASLRMTNDAFRRSIEEMERMFSQQRRTEEPVAARDARAAASTTARASGGTEEQAPMPAKSGSDDPKGMNGAARVLEWPVAKAESEMPQAIEQEAAATPESASRLAEEPVLPDTLLMQGQSANSGRQQADRTSETVDEPAEETTEPVTREEAHFVPPRLSGLRGMLFWRGLQELDKLKHGEARNSSAEALLRHIEPLEKSIESACSPDHGKAVRQADAPGAAEADPSSPVAEAIKMTSGAETEERRAQDSGSPNGTAPSNLPQTKAEKRGKGAGRGDGRERADDVQVLPSRRGQYKRKG
jgi:hypothetical protein